MSTHDELVEAFETYLMESAKFEEKGIKASSARARGSLSNFTKLAKTRRAEIQAKKNNM
jgi:hypothetical protein